MELSQMGAAHRRVIASIRLGRSWAGPLMGGTLYAQRSAPKAQRCTDFCGLGVLSGCEHTDWSRF